MNKKIEIYENVLLKEKNVKRSLYICWLIQHKDEIEGKFIPDDFFKDLLHHSSIPRIWSHQGFFIKNGLAYIEAIGDKKRYVLNIPQIERYYGINILSCNGLKNVKKC